MYAEMTCSVKEDGFGVTIEWLRGGGGFGDIRVSIDEKLGIADFVAIGFGAGCIDNEIEWRIVVEFWCGGIGTQSLLGGTCRMHLVFLGL